MSPTSYQTAPPRGEVGRLYQCVGAGIAAAGESSAHQVGQPAGIPPVGVLCKIPPGAPRETSS
jgi:hypothetical protein